LNIDNKKSPLPIGVTLARSEVTFVDANTVNNNVNNNNILFSADDSVLIKLLRQENKYGANKFIAEFSSKPWTLSVLNKRLPNTGHFTFWSDLTKAAVGPNYCLC